jgi:hypothetical protein
MRNGFLALAAAFLGANVPSAEDWAEKMFVKDNAPHLNHDFGVVGRGALLHHDFPVTNIYDVPIEISSVRVS